LIAEPARLLFMLMVCGFDGQQNCPLYLPPPKLELSCNGTEQPDHCLKDHIPIPDGFLVCVTLPTPFIRTFTEKAAEHIFCGP
jgi:hypothetical protein